jgi:hypothetical protein
VHGGSISVTIWLSYLGYSLYRHCWTDSRAWFGLACFYIAGAFDFSFLYSLLCLLSLGVPWIGLFGSELWDVFTFVSSVVVGFFLVGLQTICRPACAGSPVHRLCVAYLGGFRGELEILSGGGVHHNPPAHGYVFPLCTARGRGGGEAVTQRRGGAGV